MNKQKKSKQDDRKLKELLTQLYLEEELSIRTMASRFGISTSTMHGLLKKFSIPTRKGYSSEALLKRYQEGGQDE